MIAMPPITIHGIPDASSAFVKAASASSIRRSPATRLLRTTLHQCPSAPDSFNALLADRVAGARPQAHGLESVQRGQRLGHGLRWSGAFGRLQAALAVRSLFVASLPAPNPGGFLCLGSAHLLNCSTTWHASGLAVVCAAGTRMEMLTIPPCWASSGSSQSSITSSSAWHRGARGSARCA
jgi:hypothetical protein